MMITRRLGCLMLIAIGACGKNDAPKTPLSSASSSADVQPAGGISGDAKRALDSGNNLFRVKDYRGALAQYQRSSELAPEELSPLLGIMMVADATHDAKLSDETLPRIRKLSPGAADSALTSPHSKIIRNHPRSGPPSTTP